jgi:negative regulator of flagellin synthesis FlgM
VPNRIKGMDGGSIGPDNSNPIEKIRVSTPVSSGSSGSTASAPASDSVHITGPARTLASLSQAVSESPDVDVNRVAALQQSISNGSYRINPERIADSMLQLEQELGNSKKQ